ncbi:3-oxoacyl-ACP reductase [soil metagenome]
MAGTSDPPPDGGRLGGKVVLITGAAGGLGAVAAELFAVHGARIVVADFVDGAATVARVEAVGGAAITVTTDVTDSDSVAAAVAAAVEHFGALDVLYNNAGISPEGDDTPVNTPDDVYQRVMDVNVRGVFMCCKHGIPALLDTAGRRRAGGDADATSSIINVASFVAHLGSATSQVAYTASKGAVLSMTREVAVHYARQGVRANALCPGPVLTPLLAKFLSDDATRQRRLVHVPMGRFGHETDIANAALFLASDESSFMTGQSLIIDGGITAAYTTPE